LCHNFLASDSGVQLNPKRIIRTLNLPFKEIMYPSISADGNWIAFSAADVSGKWNVYLSHSSSGEAPIGLITGKNFLFGQHRFHQMGVMFYMKLWILLLKKE